MKSMASLHGDSWAPNPPAQVGRELTGKRCGSWTADRWLLPLARARRELGDHLDLQSVAPDAQRQPCAWRLPADDVDEIVGAAHLDAGGTHHMIASLEASRFGD